MLVLFGSAINFAEILNTDSLIQLKTRGVNQCFCKVALMDSNASVEWWSPVTSSALEFFSDGDRVFIPVRVDFLTAPYDKAARLLWKKFSAVLSHGHLKRTLILYGGSEVQRKLWEMVIKKEKRFSSVRVLLSSQTLKAEIETLLDTMQSSFNFGDADQKFSAIGKLWDLLLSCHPMAFDSQGLVHEEVFDVVFGSIKDTPVNNSSEFTDFLQQAQLIFPYDDKRYVIPSLLYKRGSLEPLADAYSQVSPLYLEVGTDYVGTLSEIFFATCLRLIKKLDLKNAEFFCDGIQLEINNTHILRMTVDEDESRLKATVAIKTRDPSFWSIKSAEICEEIKHVLMDDQIPFTMGILDEQAKFISLPIPHLLILSDSTAYLWSDTYSPKKNFIQRHYAELERDIVVRSVLGHLRQRGSLSAADYEAIVSHSHTDYHAGRLLNLFSQRGNAGVEELADALHSTGQSRLADLIREPKQPMAPAGTQESDTTMETPRPTLPNETASSQLNRSALPRPTVPTTQIPSVVRDEVALATPTPLPTADSPKFLPASIASTRGKGEPTMHPIFEAKYYHVERATDYFNERPYREGGKRLGSGSFGTVYYALLHSETGEKFEVAVKRLKKASSLNPAQIELTKKQFGNEINLLSKYVHECILSLVGFSSDGPELCLIYEFMSNGSLSHRLDCRDNTRPLPWTIRLTITRDIACGLDYLHNEFRLSVIHRDIKSSNILLSVTFKAKISDFGLAVVSGDQEAASPVGGTRVGTKPYMPEEVFQGIVTPAFDVYAFGVVIYEIVTGLPPYSSKKKKDLRSYVAEIEDQGIDLQKMLDPNAKWPKATRRSDGRLESAGLGLFAIAKRATLLDYKNREGIDKILFTLKNLVAAEAPSN